MYFSTYQCSIKPSYPTKKAGHMDATELINNQHDPIEARFIYLENDDQHILHISCDLLGLPYPFYQKIQKIVNEYFACKITLLLSCTHTHYSYDIENKTYLNTLEIIIKDALKKLKPKYYPNLYIAYQIEEFNEISSSRISNYHQEQIYLSLLNIYDDSKLLACIIIHNTHPTILAANIPYFSSEFCGYCLQALSRKYPETFFSYLSGASGDISTRFKRLNQTYEAVIDAGNKLVNNIEKMLKNMSKEEIKQIKVKEDKLIIKHDYTPLTIKDATNLSPREQISLSYGIIIRDKLSKEQNSFPFINITTLSINNYQFIFIPNEIFSAYLNALNLKQQILISYTNGYEPYILPQDFDYFCYEAFCDTTSKESKKQLYQYLKNVCEN